MASDAASRARQFGDAFHEALSGPAPAFRDASPLSTLLNLPERVSPSAATDEEAGGAPFPEITDANLEAAVAEFRRLLKAELPATGRLRLWGEDSRG